MLQKPEVELFSWWRCYSQESGYVAVCGRKVHDRLCFCICAYILVGDETDLRTERSDDLTNRTKYEIDATVLVARFFKRRGCAST